ncbi:MAG: hypothetical protein JWR85_4230 [Marmoricola sp.]|nr:hypothetical protein [Marmoricola sp.]
MKIKRGDTFLFFGLLPAEFPAGTWAATCAVEAPDGTKFPVTATVAAPVAPATQYGLTLRAEAAATALWLVGKYKGDVQFTNTAVNPAFVMSSKDFSFEVLADKAP